MSDCICGRPRVEINQNVITQYKEKEITVKNVPFFICSNDHSILSRIARVNLKERLKVAYEKGLSEIEYLN